LTVALGDAEAMREFQTATSIAASPEEAWALLADLERYPEWHPLVERMGVQTHWSTRLKVLARISRKVRLGGSVLEWQPPHRIEWEGGHPVWGLLRIKYGLAIMRDRDGSTVVQTVRVGGLLPRIVPSSLSSVPDALAESAHAIKQRVERQPRLRAAA